MKTYIKLILICVGNLNRSDWIPWVVNGIKVSQNIQNMILNNPKLKSHKAVIDKENIIIPEISKKKRPAQSIIQNVQH